MFVFTFIAEQSSPNGAAVSIDNSLVNITNNIESHRTRE